MFRVDIFSSWVLWRSLSPSSLGISPSSWHLKTSLWFSSYLHLHRGVLLLVACCLLDKCLPILKKKKKDRMIPGQFVLLLDLYQVHRPQQNFPLTTLSFVASGHLTSLSNLVDFSSLNQTPVHCTPPSKGHLSRSECFLWSPSYYAWSKEMHSHTTLPNPPHWQLSPKLILPNFHLFPQLNS